ncbi:MAG: quinate 5-dehydrogenase [Armatimonadetes bacterium]|nr:quinate 5-dehydrogenase [Armatimonadota bacterium]
MSEPKRIVSVSLGTSKRDKIHETEILGQRFLIERRGTDGDRSKFKALMEELDGQVAALGVGGADIWIATSKKKYAFREIVGLVSGVKKTPVVDGSGLKHTLERETIHRLQRDGTVDFRQERALLVSAVDRFGMAQALNELCPDVIYGDLLFGLGLPLPIKSYRTVEVLASMLAPIVTQLPLQWFYPTGSKQEERKPSHVKIWAGRTFLCGDWHYIRRYAPDDLSGKTVLTQTVRSADIEWLRSTGLRRLITTTPDMGGETFATNVMEGVIVALSGKGPAEMAESDYLDVLKELDWSPTVLELG